MRWFTTSEHLWVEVRDQGVGIDEQEEELVMEPAFTTKDSGLGLGLFLARSMAEQFGGDLTIKRQKEGGTLVIVTFSLHMIRKKQQ